MRGETGERRKKRGKKEGRREGGKGREKERERKKINAGKGVEKLELQLHYWKECKSVQPL